MESRRNVTLLTVLCVLGWTVLRVQAASLQNHHSKTGHAKLPSHRLILDLPGTDTSRSIRPINNDSISPWEYTHTEDADLFPSVLTSARCLLTGCLDREGKETQNLESKPILTQILVLRRVRTDQNNYHFRLEYRTVSVGCTCVRPHVQLI